MYKRLYNFLIKYNILFDNQYGFRKDHSTALALLHLYDTLANAIDNKEYTMGVFSGAPAARRAAKRSPISIPYMEI